MHFVVTVDLMDIIGAAVGVLFLAICGVLAIYYKSH